jgi:hypothetical protein
MNQALYAHMNNKRKMKKKKNPPASWVAGITGVYHYVGSLPPLFLPIDI